MATITKFLKGAATRPTQHINTHLMQAENILDFTATGFDDILAADDVQCIILPQQAVVTKVTYQFDAAGPAGTGEIGDTDVTDGWEVIADLTVTDLTVGSGSLATDGKRYEAFDRTIDFIPSVDMTAGVLWIAVEYYIRDIF